MAMTHEHSKAETAPPVPSLLSTINRPDMRGGLLSLAH